MATLTIEVNGQKYTLPKGLLAQVFDCEGNVSILAPNPKGAFSGYSVVDSVQLRAHRGAEAEAVVGLLTRHGAVPTPTGAVG